MWDFFKPLPLGMGFLTSVLQKQQIRDATGNVSIFQNITLYLLNQKLING